MTMNKKLSTEILSTKMTPDEFLDYIDNAIRSWREKKTKANEEIITQCYIDAYQSVRISLFGELLPVEPDVESKSIYYSHTNRNFNKEQFEREYEMNFFSPSSDSEIEKTDEDM